MTTKIKSDMPPVIFESKNGRWAVSGSVWIAIGPDVTLDQVRSMWIDTSSQYKDMKTPKPKEVISVPVKSSRSEITYIVTYDGTRWKCDCLGFQFNRDCRHIKEQKRILDNQ